MSTRLPGTYFIQDLALFPTYVDREDYFEKTGKTAPLYDPRFPIKNWEDPAVAGQRFVTYTVFEWDKINPPREGELILPGSWAARVNLLPRNFTGLTDEEKKAQEAGAEKTPIRPLKASEIFRVYLGDVYVLDTAISDLPLAPVEGGDGFTKKDRELLQKVADKLGVK